MLATLVAKLILTHVAHLMRDRADHGGQSVTDALRNADDMAPIFEAPIAADVFVIYQPKFNFVGVGQAPALKGPGGPKKLVSIF